MMPFFKKIIRRAVETIHPYQTTCILKFDVESNKSYAEWIHDEMK